MVISTGYTTTLTYKVKVDQNTTALTMNFTYGAGLGYVAASAVPSAGTMNGGGTQWVIPVVTANTEYTIEIDVEVTDEVLFSAGTRAVSMAIVALAGETNTADNSKSISIDGLSCSDLQSCTAAYQYHANVTQAGTSNPAATASLNTLGEVPTLTRTGPGVYEVTLVGTQLATASKVDVQATLGLTATAAGVKAGRFSATVVRVLTFDDAGAPADLVGDLYLSIIVRP